MATLVSIASGNLTASTTWGVVDPTSFLNSESGASTLSLGLANSAAFTPGAITIDAIGVKLACRLGITGTLTISLQTGGAAVTGTSVTINVADLPAITSQSASDGGWHVFKLAAPVTLAAATAYTVGLLTSSGAQVLGYTNGTANNWCRLLRTTTQQAPSTGSASGPGDDLIIAGEYTNNVAGTPFTANTSNASTTLTSVSSVAGLFVGQPVTGANFQDGTAITAINAGANTITVNLTPNTTATGVTITPYLSGASNSYTVTMDNTAAFTSVVLGGTHTSGSPIVTGISSTTGLTAGMGVSTIGGQLPANTFILSVDSSTQVTLTRNATISGSATNTFFNAYGQFQATSTVTPALGICNKGTLAFGSTASTNYILRLAGCAIVYRGGTLNIGTVATPIPRSSTAILEFQQFSADGDYGLIIRDGGAWTSQGLSRTSGKNVDRALLSGGGYFSGLNGFGGTAATGSPIITNVTATAFGTFALGDAIGEHNTNANIAAGMTIIGYIDGSGVATGDTSGLANRQIKMSANAINGIVTTLYTNAFGGSKLLTINTDTGWLAGDQIAVASTTRTAADCETGVLSGNATSTQLPVQGFVAAAAGQALPLAGPGGLLNRHDGMSPVQAEVILLTRNVKIRSTSNTLMSYVFIGNSSTSATAITVDVDWTEFYYVATNSPNKRGVEVDVSNGSSVSIQYSSIHDCEAGAFLIYGSGGDGGGVTFSNNVIWNTAGLPAIQILNAVSGVTWVMDNNIIMRTLSGNCVTLNDIGGTFTNNKAIGAGSVGINFAENTATFGNFAGNVSHSNGSYGFSTNNGQSGVVSTITAWRNTSSGLNINSIFDVLFDGAVLFGNALQNINSAASCDVRLKDFTVNGDTSFATPVGLNFNTNSMLVKLILDNCDFGTVSGIKTAHATIAAADINCPFSAVDVQMLLRNTKLSTTTEVANQANLSGNSTISSQKHDQTTGNHRTWKRDGTISSDTTIFRTTSPSERLAPSIAAQTINLTANGTTTSIVTFGTPIIGAWIWHSIYFPNGAQIVSYNLTTSSIVTSVAASSTGVFSSNQMHRQLQSGSKLVALASGASATIGVWVRKSVSGDGIAYMVQSLGVVAQPRLIQKANPAMGINSDIVLATASGAAGAWEQLTATISNASGDNGVVEVCVDCAGSTGWVNVDDWSVT